MEKNNSILDKLLNLDYIVAVLSLVILIIVTFWGVIMRYFIQKPLIWGEEVQLFCFLWTIFFGAGAAFRANGHVAIDILVDFFPARLRRITEIFAYLVVISILLFLFKNSLPLIIQLARTNRTTNILRIPYFIIYSALPISCILMIINYTKITYIAFKKGVNL